MKLTETLNWAGLGRLCLLRAFKARALLTGKAVFKGVAYTLIPSSVKILVALLVSLTDFKLAIAGNSENQQNQKPNFSWRGVDPSPAAKVGPSRRNDLENRGPKSSPLTASDALLDYLKNQQHNSSSSAQQYPSSAVPSAAVQSIIDKLKASNRPQNDQLQHIDFHLVTGPSAGAFGKLQDQYNQPPLGAVHQMSLPSSSAAGPSSIRPRQGYYGQSSFGGGGGQKFFGTISPYTFDAALTAIAVTAFLTYALRIIINAINGTAGRKKRSAGNPWSIQNGGEAEEDELEVLTKKVLPAVQKNWANMPPFAPEVAYLGFEMLWNYWKEKGLNWSKLGDDERRICVTYRRLKGESKENYQKAQTTWDMLSKVGVSWSDPYLNAVERGLNGDSCTSSPSFSDEIRTWG